MLMETAKTVQSNTLEDSLLENVSTPISEHLL